MMYSESLVKLGKVRSEIREIFEYGNKRKAEIGAENVFDFSIGNPSVPAPKIVDDTIKDLVDNFDSVALHGYTSAQGDAHVRQSISDYINGRFGTKLTANHIYMTCGAASSLTIGFKMLLCYRAKNVLHLHLTSLNMAFSLKEQVLSLLQFSQKIRLFQIDMEKFEAAINEKTKAVIINSPNNPSGVVYTKEQLKKMCDLLRKKKKNTVIAFCYYR